MLSDATKETLALIRGKLGQPGEPIQRSWVQPGSPTTGMQQYNLEKPAKRLFPVLTPLRNVISRTGGGFATAVNWKAVTGINTTRVAGGIQEGKRGGVITTTTAEFSAGYKALGLEDDVTFEAQYAGKNFTDIKAMSSANLLDAFFLLEEDVILGGNNSIALGTPTAPAGVAAAAGTATTTRAAVKYRVVALTHFGWYNSNHADLTVGVATAATRTNADGTTTAVKLGSSAISAESASVSVTAGDKVTLTWPAVVGAVGYAIFSGATGACKLLSYSTVNKYVVVADEAGGSQAATAITADNSQDSLVFDGIITQIVKSGNNGYVKSLDGAKLTPTGKGTVAEIDAALQSFWDNYKLSPDIIYCAAEQYTDICNATLTGSGSTVPILSLSLEGGQRNLMAGTATTSYLNKVAPGGSKELQIRVHPNLVNGTIILWSNSLPYKLSGVPSIFEIEERQSYYMIDWPLTTRKWQFGIYVDEVMKCYAPFSCGVITNIAPGLN